MSSATSNSGASQEGGRGSAALLIGAALSGFDGGAIGFLLPAVRADTGSDPQQAAWLVTLYALGTLVAIPAAGAAVRRFGGHVVFRVCAVVSACGSLLAIVSPGITSLLAARLLQGLAQGPLIPVAAAIVAVQWPTERHGRLMGVLSLVYGSAFVGAMALTPMLLTVGWRSVFGVTLAIAVASLLAPRVEGASQPAPRRSVTVPLFGRSREIWAIAVLSLATGIGQAAIVLFPTLAVQRLGVTASGTGLLMLPLAAAGILATVGIAATLDRIGAKRLMTSGAVAAITGILIASALRASQTTFLLAAGMLGLGMSLLSGGPLRYAAARAVTPDQQGPAQAGVALLTNVGVVGATVLVGALAARGADERAAMEAAMILVAGIMAALFVPVVFLRRHSRHHDDTGPADAAN